MDPDLDPDDIEPLIDAGARRILLYARGSDGIPGTRRVRDHRDRRDREAGKSTVHAEVCGVPLEARHVRSRHMLYDGKLRSPRINDEAVRGAFAETLCAAWSKLPDEAREEIGRIRSRIVPTTEGL